MTNEPYSIPDRRPGDPGYVPPTPHNAGIHKRDCGWWTDASQCDCSYSPSVPTADSVGTMSTTDHYNFTCYHCSATVYYHGGQYDAVYCTNCGYVNYGRSRTTTRTDMSPGPTHPRSDMSDASRPGIYYPAESVVRAYTNRPHGYRIGYLIGYARGYGSGYRDGTQANRSTYNRW